MRFLWVQHGHVTASSNLIGSAHIPVGAMVKSQTLSPCASDVVHLALQKAGVRFMRLAHPKALRAF